MPKEFTCNLCKGTFAEAWTEADAVADCVANFGRKPTENDLLVCDVCYQLLLRTEDFVEIKEKLRLQ